RPLGRAEYESGLSYGPFIEADTFYWMANIPSSGMAVEWLRRVVPPGTPPVDYDTVDRLLAGQPAGPSGLLFGPFLSGMGTPSYNERLRGCLLGLDENTGFAQMLKAVVEGVALQGRSILTLAPAADGPLLVAGGAANSAPWMQLKADVMQRPLRVSELREGALYGAAGLLARQLGAPFARPQGCSALYTPNTTLAPAYAALHHRYQGLVDWLSAEAAQPREHQGKQQEEQQQNG
ncbi:hypothetical protein LJC60_11230, partial [Ruminococcaceae bacterium OttesenSCG-928-D13]|nr:hypothetical protein [Ruminococcaceae bacterium OttesenSCG-928-D13]